MCRCTHKDIDEIMDIATDVHMDMDIPIDLDVGMGIAIYIDMDSGIVINISIDMYMHDASVRGCVFVCVRKSM